MGRKAPVHRLYFITCAHTYLLAGMLTRPTWHEAEARESEAKAKEIFQGRGQNVWGQGRRPVL